MANNFDQIQKAHNVLSSVKDSMYVDLEVDDDIIDELEEHSVFYVTFTPDYKAIKNTFINSPYKKKLSDGSIVDIPAKQRGKFSKFATKRVITDIAERLMEDEYRRGVGKNRYPLGRWRIEVGFLNPSQTHYGATTDISIGQLLVYLLAYGYDPLMTARDPRYKSRIEKEMAKAIMGTRNDYFMLGRRVSIRPLLESIAKRIRNDICAYIEGGNKPALDSKTIRNRKYKQSSDPSLYPEGISEPLEESGELESLVWYRVIGESRYLLERERLNREIEERKEAKEREAKRLEEAKKNGSNRTFKDYKESGKQHEVKNRKTLTEDEVQEQQDRLAMAEEERKPKGGKRAGRFWGMNPNTYRDAITITRIILLETKGSAAILKMLKEQNQFTDDDVNAFGIAKQFLTNHAMSIGVPSLKEFLQSMGII